MKIVEVIPHLCTRAGAEVLFVNLCLSLKKDYNMDVEVVTLFDGINSEFIKLFNENNIRYYTLGKKEGFDYKCAKKFRKLITQINPTIIHSHLNSIVTYYLAFGSKHRKWKVFHTVHTSAQIESNKVSKIIRKKLLKHKILINIAISPSIKETILDFYGRNYDVPVVYNGIKIKKVNIKNKQFDFINVARFDAEKNQKFLIETFKLLIDEYPDVKLVLVGSGSLFESAKQLVTKLGIERNVTFTGYTNDVYRYLEFSKYFVLPSIFEGNPISIIEAMNCGLPIIASNVGGIPDVVKSKRNGLLINPNNKTSLFNAMKQLLTDSNLSEEISLNNLKDVQQYSIKECAGSYLDIFEDYQNE